MGTTSRSCTVDVRFFPPPEELEGCFTTFYRAEITSHDGAPVRDWLQPEWANLRWFTKASPEAQIGETAPISGTPFLVHGPSTLATDFTLGTTRMWGVGLFPLGWAKFANSHAAELANTVHDGLAHPSFPTFRHLATALFSDSPDDQREYQLIKEAFLAIDREVRDEEVIRSIHAAIVDPEIMTVRALVETSGIAQRRLERFCRRYFGFPPKALLRRQRFMRSLADYMVSTAENWTEAMDAGYHDQAQFTREFRNFMGMSPREYASMPHDILGAFMAERKRLHGSPVQTLDKPARS